MVYLNVFATIVKKIAMVFKYLIVKCCPGSNMYSHLYIKLPS